MDVAKFGIGDGVNGVPSAAADFSDTAGSVASTDERPPSAEDFSFRAAPAPASPAAAPPVADANTGFDAPAAAEEDAAEHCQAPAAEDTDGAHVDADGEEPVCSGVPSGTAAAGEQGADAAPEEAEADGAQEKENCAQNLPSWQPAAAPLVTCLPLRHV